MGEQVTSGDKAAFLSLPASLSFAALGTGFAVHSLSQNGPPWLKKGSLMVKKLIFASKEGKLPRPKAHAASRS
jgi:hypothetical protein